MVQGIYFVIYTLSICPSSKRRSAACNDRDVLSCGLCKGVEPCTGHLVCQWTHGQQTVPESVVLLLALLRTCFHVLTVP
jgi:hypothetical protein